MKKYDFDELINRENTDCVKVDAMKKAYGVEDAIPMWVADMDFRTPDFIMDAIRKRCEHEVLGYTFPSKGYYEAIVRWVADRHQWTVTPDSIQFLAGVVPGLAHCLNAFTKPGDSVVIQPPVYMPFQWIPDNLKRRVIHNPLVEVDGMYRMNLEHLEELFKEGHRLLVLCNPHNPSGRSWSKEELTHLALLCERYGAWVISDEIHSDIMLNGSKHIPFATVSDYAEQHSITLMAPSKTFNIAGLATSFSIILNETMREKFHQYIEATELANGTIFSFVAAQAAYENGMEWLTQLRNYVWENVCLVREFMRENLPEIHPMVPQATYLMWLDCRELGMTRDELCRFFYREAKVVMNEGSTFGLEGEGFMRMNLAFPRSVVLKALNQIKVAFEVHKSH